MDLDAMHKEVAGLKNFRARVERAIAFMEGLQAGGFMPGAQPEGGAAVALSDDQLAAITKPLANALDAKLQMLDVTLASYDDRLKSIEAAKLDPTVLERLETMLTWFDANQEGLEVLLSLDGDPDADTSDTNEPGTAGSTGSGGAIAGAGDVSGASGAVSGTDAAAGAGQAAPAAPQDGTGQPA